MTLLLCIRGHRLRNNRHMVTMETDAALEHDGSSQSIVGSDMASGVGRV